MATGRVRGAVSSLLRALSQGLLLVVIASIGAIPASAVMIDALITPLGGSFRYEISVSNNEAEELLIASLSDAPVGDSLIGPSLTTPSGFLASYDSGLGIVDFLADTGSFAVGSTVDGFVFESLSGPGTFFTTFEALGITGTTYAGTVRSRVVPDTGSTLALLGLVAGALSPLIRRYSINT